MVRETLKEKIMDSSTKQKDKALKNLFFPSMETDFKTWKEEKNNKNQG